jgi:hypothetical protein
VVRVEVARDRGGGGEPLWCVSCLVGYDSVVAAPFEVFVGVGMGTSAAATALAGATRYEYAKYPSNAAGTVSRALLSKRAFTSSTPHPAQFTMLRAYTTAAEEDDDAVAAALLVFNAPRRPSEGVVVMSDGTEVTPREGSQRERSVVADEAREGWRGSASWTAVVSVVAKASHTCATIREEGALEEAGGAEK